MEASLGPMLNLAVVEDRIQFRILFQQGAGRPATSDATIKDILTVCEECEQRAGDLFRDSEQVDRKLEGLKESLRELALKAVPKSVRMDLRDCLGTIRLD